MLPLKSYQRLLDCLQNQAQSANFAKGAAICLILIATPRAICLLGYGAAEPLSSFAWSFIKAICLINVCWCLWSNASWQQVQKKKSKFPSASTSSLTPPACCFAVILVDRRFFMVPSWVALPGSWLPFPTCCSQKLCFCLHHCGQLLSGCLLGLWMSSPQCSVSTLWSRKRTLFLSNIEVVVNPSVRPSLTWAMGLHLLDFSRDPKIASLTQRIYFQPSTMDGNLTWGSQLPFMIVTWLITHRGPGNVHLTTAFSSLFVYGCKRRGSPFCSPLGNGSL